MQELCEEQMQCGVSRSQFDNLMEFAEIKAERRSLGLSRHQSKVESWLTGTVPENFRSEVESWLTGTEVVDFGMT